MKFKKGDVLMHIPSFLSTPHITVIGVQSTRRTYRIRLLKGVYTWTSDYVEMYYEKQTKLRKLLSEVSDEN